MSFAADGGPRTSRRDEPGKAAAWTFAVAIHLAFFALLVFGVSWQSERPAAVNVELWSALPPVPDVKPPPKPAAKPKPEPKPEPPPKPEPKPEPPPPPKPEPKPEPPPPPPKPEPKPEPKPDIALEQEKAEKAKRAEKERAEREEKARQEKLREEKARQEKIEREKALAKKREQEALAAKKREEERRRQAALDAERAAREAEMARIAKEQQDAMRRLQQQQQAASARASVRDEYIGRIRAKIRQYVTLPPDIPGNPQVEFDVVLLPTGDVLGVKLRKSSQHAAYDAAVERAILRAQPLPVPPDPSMFRDFRELKLQFRPNE